MPTLSDGQSAPAHVEFPVVGLGASAGGVPALQQFFEALPATTGAAYVVVLHLLPGHPSSLDAVLQQATPMPVVQITTTTVLERNHVYVVAPSSVVRIVDSSLVVSPTTETQVVTAAIDLFLRSLAQACRENAIGIIFSGAGSDGSMGIKRIKELGGVTMAQSPDETEHPSMPRTAIATGMVDFTLGASEMPQRLVDLWSQARRIRLPAALMEGADSAQAETDMETADPFSERSQRALREILIVVRTRTGHDFRHYKQATILKRVERRLKMHALSDLEQYRDFIHLHPEETKALLQDLLVSATQFFRDSDAYERLRKDILPLLFSERDGTDPVRVWTAGCATGEEAYSIAMLLQEASGDAVPFQVFATDVDERAIDVARQGVYPSAVLVDVDPSRIKKYFIKTGIGYRVKKDLRERVLFAVHDVLRDPPFSRLDLICCRNLLVYLDRQAQIDTLQAFHFALKRGGFLFLGAAETVEAASALFSTIDKKAHIFASDGATHPAAPFPHDAPIAKRAMHGAAPALSVLSETGKRRVSLGDLHGRLLEDYAFPSVLVNRKSEILHVSDRAGRFLQFVGGQPSHNVLAAIRPELRTELRTAIYTALQSLHRVDTRPVRLRHEGQTCMVRMIARTVHDDEANDDFVLILFDEMPVTSKDEPSEPEVDRNTAIVMQLEQELESVKRRLQETVEVYETSNEELRASNEELQATNAQLASAAEALELNKADLEQVNSRLSSVNSDLEARAVLTNKISDDLRNLIEAADIATIFVDRDFRIVRFTPRAKDIFLLLDSYIGRALAGVEHRLEYDRLQADVEQVCASLRVIEREVRSHDGRWFHTRFVPYRATGDFIDGAVLAFFDITQRRISEERLHTANEAMRDAGAQRQDEFLAVVSHELKHPLHLISASAELIARSAAARAEPVVARAAHTISRTVSGQAQIIDDLLDISRVRTGKLSITRASIDLADTVRRIGGTVQQEARTDGIDFVVSVPDSPVTIEADLTRIEQVLWNLISNALKYTNHGGKISMTLTADEAVATLVVSDDGMGIDPSVLPSIFEMFQRGQNAGAARSGGLGIGLSLVKELVALHGGRVSARSDGLGRGATFTVEFSRAFGRAPATPGDTASPAFLRDTEVVLVDDDRETVDAFKMLLETEGANVIVATAGDEALRILDQRCPSFILSDLGMPGMTGIQLIEAVRQRNRLAGVKAIALSGFGRDSDVEAALQAGFDAHLTKPVTLSLLLSTMARLRAR
jgi:two-component system CheB/CheR fusion protein